jgi:hypothetical protein
MPPMRAAFRPTLALALLVPVWAHAQTQGEQAVPADAPRGGEPRVEVKVSEDDQVRIEELRVRGETRRIVVHSKIAGVRSYEVLPAGQGRDLSQDKRAIGQRVWSVLSF